MYLYLLSFIFAVTVLTLLVVFSALKGDTSMVIGFSIYGAALVLFYLVRAFYVHEHPQRKFKETLLKLDHIMIYLLTAATYTPVALLLPQRGWGWSMFGVVWGIFLVGAVARAADIVDKRWTTIFVYSSLLVLDLIVFGVVHTFLSKGAVMWLTIGGVSYLIETFLVVARPGIFKFKDDAYEKLALPFMLFGSFAHFWAMLKYIILI